MKTLVTACLPFPHPPHVLMRQQRDVSRRLVADSFPQLVDLVEDGTLLVLERSSIYRERRDDGFQEPLLLFLLGTSHFSTVSALQVHRVVSAVRPQNVVVELCRSRSTECPLMFNLWNHRAGLMNEIPNRKATVTSQSNLLSITGKSFGAALACSLEIGKLSAGSQKRRTGGQSAMILGFLLALVSEKITSVAGVASGEEFRAAYKAAAQVDAQVVLGDRPIEITLRRAWEALDWVSRLKLTAFLLRGISSKLDLSEESLQALRSDDALSSMFSYLSQEFPALLQPLIHERDRYLAWSLTRSKAVNGSSRVVGVVGRGHMKGVVHALKHERETLSFHDVAGIGAKAVKQDAGRQMRRILARLFVETVLGFALWLAYDHWCANGIIPPFGNFFEMSSM